MPFCAAVTAAAPLGVLPLPVAAHAGDCGNALLLLLSCRASASMWLCAELKSVTREAAHELWRDRLALCSLFMVALVCMYVREW